MDRHTDNWEEYIKKLVFHCEVISGLFLEHILPNRELIVCSPECYLDTSKPEMSCEHFK